jgi:two-component system KDP operon response regulator KdpE
LTEDHFEVFACDASFDSSRLIEEVQPDLVIIGCEGEAREVLAVCERVRGLTDRPVVVLSSRCEDIVIARAFDLGVDEYLALPIGDHALRARLVALVRRSKTFATSSVREVGGLTLWPAEQAATISGKKISLSPIQFRLLSCLAAAPGTVLTHQTLMSRVWGAEYVDSRHYLRLYIRYLRERLEADPNNPKMVLSEWGVGYRFEPPPVLSGA